MSIGKQHAEAAPRDAVRSRRGQLRAVTWLLVVCAGLAAGLIATGAVNYRAARRAADAVLESRASEAAVTLSSAARISDDVLDDAALQRLVQEHATAEIQLVVVDPQGGVHATSRPRSEVRRPPPSVLGELRVGGQATRVVFDRAGQPWLELWRPLFVGRPPPPPMVPLDGSRPPRPITPWGDRATRGRDARQRGTFGRRRRHPELRLLQVRASSSLAETVLRPARLAGLTALAAALGLLFVGLALHRSARRAWRAEVELQRRRVLASLGEMAAVLAHEIRTPLGSIKGNAQLVSESTGADDLRVTSIVREAERLERLVNGLLDYARPVEPRRAACDPDTLVERAAEIVASQARAAEVDLMVEPARCGACLLADGDQLLQVVVNVVQNALQATAAVGDGAERAPVVVRVRRRSGEIVIDVLDRGPGLRGADVEQLLRPFYSTRAGGSGLGLSVARQIVEQHGGQLTLSDRERGGLRASIALPLRS